MKHFIALGALVLAAPAFARPASQPPVPPEHPDWSEASREAVRQMTQDLRDPASAEIVWTSGYVWGYMKPLLGRRSFAWIACGTVNAKNGLGGYVGASPYFVAVEQDGTVYARPTGIMTTNCDEGAAAPINLELVAALPNRAASALSVADELKKLAELRDSGVLTSAEFEAQKAKLLAPTP